MHLLVISHKKSGKGMYSNTTMSIKVYLMAILDSYMFRPLLAIFRLSSRELKVLLYTLYAHVVQRSLHTGPYVEISAPRARKMYIVGP